MVNSLLMAQAVSTLSMVGLIWFVQIVHYPLFDSVGKEEFAKYEQRHQQRTGFVVIPFMLVEATSSVFLVIWPPERIALPVAWLGLALTAFIWAMTFFVQVPAHERLASSFDASIHRRLVRSNWFRTMGWSARGVLVCIMMGVSL